MKYTAKYFSDQFPDWKRKKDSLMAQLFCRRLSFYVSSIACNLGFSANDVSYFSLVVGVVACCLMVVPNRACRIIGAALVLFWGILDCADGNIARCVRKQAFGEFADATSSYVLVGFMCTAVGVAAYNCGGVFFQAGTPWLIVIGAIASSSDSLMRLIYQKYKSNEREHADKGILNIDYDARKDNSQSGSMRSKIENEFGLSCTTATILLVATIFNALDLMVIYYFCYYFLSFVVVLIMHIRKANRYRDIEV